LSGVELTGIACVRHLWITASKGQRVFKNETVDVYYKEILDTYAKATLFVTIKGAQAWQFFARIFCRNQTHLGMWLGKKNK
jgi:hypothetical protein